MLSSALRRVAAATSLGLVLVLIASTAVSAAPRPITFEVFIGDYCFSGRAKNNSFLKVIVRDRAGNQKGREAVEADPQGFWESCVSIASGPILPGDTINVTVFDTNQKRTFTVPLLTSRIDRASNVVSGKAPDGTKVEIEAFDFRWDHWGESYDIVHTLNVNSGMYSHDFDTDNINLKGGSRVVIRWNNAGDTVRVGRFQMVPFITFQLGRSEVAGTVPPLSPIAITLRQGGVKVAAAHGVGSYGDTTWYGTFADADGEPYRVKGGEMLSAPALGGSSSWKIPAINSSTDLAADKVAGTCFANGRFVALAQDPNGFGYGFGEGTAGANGHFEIDLGDQVDIKKGFRIAVLCYSPEGDEIVSEGTAR